MIIKPLKIGNVTVKNNVFFAPLAGFSDASMRKICLKAGAGLAFTEMVSGKGLKYTPSASGELLFSYDDETVKAVQIFGSDVSVMKWVASSSYLENFDIIDINMGCPVPKIYNNGEGSALLNDLDLASKIIKAVKSSGKAVTVKFRTGVTENKLVTRDFAVMCEQSGADLITVHGRTRNAYYQGEVNFKEIESAKNAVSIPVIANGGIFSKHDADVLMDKTGADGVMVARGALENPMIFADILGIKQNFTIVDLIKEQTSLIKERYGNNRGAVIFRKQASYYLKGVKGSKRLKELIFASTSIDEVCSILTSALSKHLFYEF